MACGWLLRDAAPHWRNRAFRQSALIGKTLLSRVLVSLFPPCCTFFSSPETNRSVACFFFLRGLAEPLREARILFLSHPCTQLWGTASSCSFLLAASPAQLEKTSLFLDVCFQPYEIGKALARQEILTPFGSKMAPHQTLQPFLSHKSTPPMFRATPRLSLDMPLNDNI